MQLFQIFARTCNDYGDQLDLFPKPRPFAFEYGEDGTLYLRANRVNASHGVDRATGKPLMDMVTSIGQKPIAAKEYSHKILFAKVDNIQPFASATEKADFLRSLDAPAETPFVLIPYDGSNIGAMYADPDLCAEIRLAAREFEQERRLSWKATRLTK